MVKFIVFLLHVLLDLFLVTLQKSDRKEVTLTFPVSSPIQLECDDDLKVNNINVTMNRIKTSCLSTFKDCTLPIEAIETIKKSCNKQESCEVDIRNITNNHNCLQEYGYFNFCYACKTISNFSCDFTSSLCNWKSVNKRNRFRWVRGHRSREPYNDHTSASPFGSYVYILSSRSSAGDIAKLESGHIIATEQQCFSFWYFTTNSRDSVHVFQNKNHLLDLSYANYERRKWHHIRIPLNKTLFYSYQFFFEVTRGYWRDGSFGAIVLDDIVIENQNCNSYIAMCDFETNSCGWNDDDTNKYIWKRQKGKPRYPHDGPTIDHSTTSDNGYYLYLHRGSAGPTPAYIDFHKLNLSLSGNSCLTFWYHMYIYSAYRMGGLNVTIDGTLVWTTIGNRIKKWVKATIDIDFRKIFYIKFSGFAGDYWGNYIAIDDISLKDGTCKGLIYHEEICVDLNDDVSTETYCPKSYIDFTNARLSFDLEKNECSEHYKKTRTRLLQECRDEDDDTQKCSIDLSTDITAKPKCFQLHDIRIRHTCEAVESTTVSPVETSNRESAAAEDFFTVSPVVTSIEDASAAKESTTVLLDITSLKDSGAAEDSSTISLALTSIGDSGVVTVKGAPLPKNVDGSSDSEIGFVAGLVVAGLLLICLVILIVYLVIRHINRRGSNEKIRNELRENDYIGCQDIALSHTAGRSNQMQNVDMYGQKSSTNTTTNTQINNVQHTCSNLGTHKEVQSPPYTVRRDDTFADNQMSNGDEYAMVGPIGETSFSKTGTSDSDLLLEPTVTGLNRTQLSKTSTGYEFAKPVLETENKIDDEDQYALSEEGVYDHSGNNRHKGLDDNIYNHAVDNIYDSGSHKRNDEGKEDTYDHFFGQKTEDDYDITTTT